MEMQLESAGFRNIRVFRGGAYQSSKLVAEINKVAESIVGMLPSGLRKAISRRFYSSVTLVGER